MVVSAVGGGMAGLAWSLLGDRGKDGESDAAWKAKWMRIHICIQMLEWLDAMGSPVCGSRAAAGADVLSVAKLAPGQEAYYEASVAQGVDDYYAGRGESPGVWVGAGAAELGLVGVIAEGALGTLMRGEDPSSGARLRPPVAVRTIYVERLDAATGERHRVARELRPVAGFDLVFSVPKSVSLLHALGDEATRFAVAQAHQAAWQAALCYLEREACVIRKGRNGVDREHGSGLVAAAFAHRTSRAQDPHLHTHVVVANAARSTDGVWRALDGDLILRSHRLAAGYLYQAQLRYELTTRLGVGWRPVVQGMAELRGVSETAVREFSTRRRQILTHLAEQGTDGWRAAQVAAITTRDRKQPLDLEALRADWAARAAEHGFGPRQRAAVVGRRQWQPPTAAGCRAIARRLVSPDGLTATRSTFTETDAIQAWCEALPDGAPVDRILATVRDFTDLPAVTAVDVSEPGAGFPRAFTTAELVAVEQRALGLACGEVRSDRLVLDPARVGSLLTERHPGLSGEQAAMVTRVAAASERVVCVVGPAGSGKTTATAALHDVLRSAGVPVVGAAPSGIAAETLQDATGIRSSTLHRLLADADDDHGRGLPRGCVLVVDEAGMADTRTLTRLLERVREADARLVLIGDPCQLGAVGPGGLYLALCDALGTVTLTANQRQHDPAERAALAALRDHDPDRYLDWAAGQGRLVACDSALEARGALLADWATHTLQQPDSAAVMIAYHRRDVAALNHAARQLLRHHGVLRPDAHTTPGGLGLVRGDRIVCLRNDPALRVMNGTRGTIVTVGRDRLLLRTTSGEWRTLPLSYADHGHLTHGYAITGHKSQGQTVDTAFVLAPHRRELAEWSYVAASRARTETRLDLAEPDLADDHHAMPIAAETVEQLANALARTANDELATRQLVVPRPLGHDRVRGVEHEPAGLEL